MGFCASSINLTSWGPEYLLLFLTYLWELDVKVYSFSGVMVMIYLELVLASCNMAGQWGCGGVQSNHCSTGGLDDKAQL